MLNGVNELDVSDIEELFTSKEPASPQENVTEPQASTENDQKDNTKAFAKRLKESTEKAVREERETIAKALGYKSYDELFATREKSIIEGKGLDPEQVTPVIDEIVQKRLDNDPRMKELEAYKKREVEEYGKRELAEITKLTDGEITMLEQLPAEVIDLWKTRGSLKAAYLELQGESLINKVKSRQSKTTTAHLNTPEGNPSSNGTKRHLTDAEKNMWKFFNPTTTDDELNKKMVDI